MNKLRALRYVAIFLLGIIAGCAVMLLLHGHQLEEQMIINRNLSLVNERQREEIHTLEKARKAERKKKDERIEEIRVTILDPKPDEILTAEITQRLEKDMAQLKEKKIEQVTEFQQLLHELVKKKVYVIEGKKVEIQLKTVVVSRVTHLFVNVRVEIVNSLAH